MLLRRTMGRTHSSCRSGRWRRTGRCRASPSATSAPSSVGTCFQLKDVVTRRKDADTRRNRRCMSCTVPQRPARSRNPCSCDIVQQTSDRKQFRAAGYNGVDNGFLRFDYVCIRAPQNRHTIAIVPTPITCQPWVAPRPGQHHSLHDFAAPHLHLYCLAKDATMLQPMPALFSAAQRETTC